MQLLSSRRVAGFAAAIVAGCAIAVAPVQAQDGGIAVGARAPSAMVHSLDGRAVDLSAVVGKGPAVLEFWATWCPNCKELEPTLSAAQKKYAGRVKFITVAVAINQSAERVRRHVAAHGMKQTVVYDSDGKAADAYDAPATSYVVVIDRTGHVVYTGVGGKQDLNAAIAKAL